MTASDPGFATDVRSWCDLTGNTLVSLATNNGVIEAVIGKGDPIVCPAPAPGSREQSPVCDPDNGATLIVFSNDLDRALAAFVLANGAAATGKHVTMFFTFWGLSVVRKAHAPKVRKDFMGRMFSGMLPKGMDDLSLSSMNMAGIGAKMMKGRMRKKNVDQLRQMFDSAKAAASR
jgi:peroxiredoxin family protein